MFVNQRSILNLRIVTDLLTLNAVFFIAAALAQSLELLFSKPNLFILLLSMNILWYFSAQFAKLYEEFSLSTFIDQAVKTVKMSIVQVVFAVVFLFFVKEFLFTRYFIIYLGLLLIIIMLVKQGTFRYAVASVRKKSRNRRRLAVAGGGQAGVKFKEALVGNPELGYEFAGFIYGDENNGGGLNLGGLQDFEKIIQSEKVTDVVIALPPEKVKELETLIRICDRNAVKTFIIPDYFDFLTSKFRINVVGNIPIITVRNNPLDEAQWRIVKRTFDILFSLAVLLFAGWWLFPLIALLIKKDSPGKTLFVQNRIGRYNEEFRCYKFRTMTTEAGKDDKNLKFAAKSDSRITKIGHFLRRYNIDEFPQFLNVLKGDMSVVGPRPHAILFDRSYTEIVEEIKLRGRVKPGITGWAQVHGLRGDVEDPEEQRIRTKQRIEHDIWYIENWTLALDLKIIAETVFQVLKRENKGE